MKRDHHSSKLLMAHDAVDCNPIVFFLCFAQNNALMTAQAAVLAHLLLFATAPFPVSVALLTISCA